MSPIVADLPALHRRADVSSLHCVPTQISAARPAASCLVERQLVLERRLGRPRSPALHTQCARFRWNARARRASAARRARCSIVDGRLVELERRRRSASMPSACASARATQRSRRPRIANTSRVIGGCSLQGEGRRALRRQPSISRADERIKKRRRVLPIWHACGVRDVTASVAAWLASAASDLGLRASRRASSAAGSRAATPLGGVVQLGQLGDLGRPRVAARRPAARASSRGRLGGLAREARPSRAAWRPRRRSRRPSSACARGAARARSRPRPRRLARRRTISSRDQPTPRDRRSATSARAASPSRRRRARLDRGAAVLDRAADRLEQRELRREVVLDHPLRPLEAQRVDEAAELRAPAACRRGRAGRRSPAASDRT